MDLSKIIACRPQHIVTEILAIRENGKLKELKRRIWNWKWFYIFRLERFEFKIIYVKTRNTSTGESFCNDFYVHKDHEGNLRLW